MTISKNREGFTLVELLVVIAIIGTLVGLLLPAIQSAREAARRSACSNNTKQLALACLNFESSMSRLPPVGNNFGNYDNIGEKSHSWITLVLPYLEETNLYNSLSSSTNKFASNTDSLADDITQKQVTLPQLICPSFKSDRVQRSCYAGAAGVIGKGGHQPSYGPGVPISSVGGGGAIAIAEINPQGQYTLGQTISAISDGTSKTFSISESAPTTYMDFWWNGRSQWNGGYDNDVTLPTCVLGTLPSGGKTSRYELQGPNSDHVAGILMHGYVDGHVGAVSEDIDQRVFGALFSRSGREPTGVNP